MRQIVYCTAIALTILLAPLEPRAQDEIRLAPGDSVAVSILQRPDLDGIFPVGEDGKIVAHVAGSIQAAGATLDELTERLREILESKLATELSIVVSAQALRPIYVVGAVRNPGQIDYRPGLTAVQAIGQVGGLGVTSLASRPRFDDSAMVLLDLQRRLARNMAETARLEAQLTASNRLDVPEEFNALAGEDAAEILRAEEDILCGQPSGCRCRDFRLSEQIELRRREASNLADTRELLNRQVTDREKAVVRVEGLFERGLTTADRLEREQRALNEDRSSLLATVVAEGRTERQLADLMSELRAFPDRRAAEFIERMATLAGEGRALRREIGALSGIGVALSGDNPPEIAIFRQTGGGIEKVPGSLGAPILPGDVVEVSLPSVLAPAPRVIIAPRGSHAPQVRQSRSPR